MAWLGPTTCSCRCGTVQQSLSAIQNIRQNIGSQSVVRSNPNVDKTERRNIGDSKNIKTTKMFL